jgi:hypothetical protein
MYKHEKVYIKNLNKLELLFFYIIHMQMCNHNTGLLDLFYYKRMEKFLLLKDFIDMDYHKKSYLTFYYVHEDQV